MKNTKSMILCSMFTVLIIVGTFVKIPIPLVPITFQVPFVLLGGILLGSRWGSMSAVIYMLLGLIGLPVFTGGGGLSYIIRPTFGYILGFIAGAFASGKICETGGIPSLWRIFISNIAGICIIYCAGFLYFVFVSLYVLGNTLNISSVFAAFILVPLPSDLISCGIAGVLARRIFLILERTGQTLTKPDINAQK